MWAGATVRVVIVSCRAGPAAGAAVATRFSGSTVTIIAAEGTHDRQPGDQRAFMFMSSCADDVARLPTMTKKAGSAS
jgi:hypothetical protein